MRPSVLVMFLGLGFFACGRSQQTGVRPPLGNKSESEQRIDLTNQEIGCIGPTCPVPQPSPTPTDDCEDDQGEDEGGKPGNGNGHDRD